MRTPESVADVQHRAAELAEEIAAGLRDGRALEWVEEMITVALLEAMRRERIRCASIAEHRAELWHATERKMSAPSWPTEARAEARERRKEAVVIADALRTDS